MISAFALISAAARPLRTVAAACLLLLSMAGVAGAAGTVPVAGSSTTSNPSKPAARPGPAKASIRLYVPDAFFVNHQPVTVPGRVLHVGGVVRPYLPGQWVSVRAYLGHRLIRSERLRLKPSATRAYGHFTASMASPGTGPVSVIVRHARTRIQQGFAARRRYAVLDEGVGFGSLGRFVELIQQRLQSLHFYIPQTGVYDQGTGLAIDAYHRLLGWGTYQTLDGPTISYLLNGWGAFRVRFPNHGAHAEGDLTHQLLALIHGSQVFWIFPMSSGKPSTPTILGDFQVYRRTPDYLPDGMYFSSFFTGGYAIHGYDPAPDYPASHGCMRLPIVDAIAAYNWLNFGDWVDTYF
ncbi:MAG: L,D-transpeptidase [Solirubrobacteraceae bacterium]